MDKLLIPVTLRTVVVSELRQSGQYVYVRWSRANHEPVLVELNNKSRTMPCEFRGVRSPVDFHQLPRCRSERIIPRIVRTQTQDLPYPKPESLERRITRMTLLKPEPCQASMEVGAKCERTAINLMMETGLTRKALMPDAKHRSIIPSSAVQPTMGTAALR